MGERAGRVAAAAGLLAILQGCATSPKADQNGCEFDYAAIQAQELTLIEQGERIAATVPDSDRTQADLALLQESSAMLDSRDRVVDPLDVSIIESARAMLVSEDMWNRQDDRNCDRAQPRISLFCALRFASVDVTGTYNHRRAALQEARIAVQDAVHDRDYAHRLRDFNNDPNTTIADVWGVLDTAHARVNYRLWQQRACMFTPQTVRTNS
ncbi:DUF6197 family protein [Aurantiacibacter zhengii]|uniref:DUF6197 family protein n=1 Tax=Aurantiacibacter zhengii TaxID=2307003 RepID=UPI0011C22DD8|nr:hypothetical protein [Aurantiacibacter zhengii]